MVNGVSFFPFGNPRSFKSNLSKCPHISILKVERVDLMGQMGVGHQDLQWCPNVTWEIHGIKDVQSNGSTWAITSRPLVEEIIELC